MNRAYDRIAFLAERGIHNRKGFRLRDVSLAEMINHLHDEAIELYRAITTHEPEPVLELADVLCIAFHIAVREGWSLAQLEGAMLRKLNERFDILPPGGELANGL